jgi:hypothetical protein
MAKSLLQDRWRISAGQRRTPAKTTRQAAIAYRARIPAARGIAAAWLDALAALSNPKQLIRLPLGRPAPALLTHAGQFAADKRQKQDFQDLEIGQD